MVEFTLVSPLLISLFLGVISYGYDFYTYNRLEEAVRAGARFASTQEYDGYASAGLTCKGDCTTNNLPKTFSFAQRVRYYTAFGDPSAASTATPVIEGFTDNNVSVRVKFVSGYPVYVSVGVTGLVLRTPLGALTLNKPVTTFAYVGNFVPTKP